MISGHRDLSSEAMLFIFFTIISTTSPAFGSVRKIFCILFLIRSAIYYRNYVALTWPSGDTTCAHYLFLRFHPAVPSLFLSGKIPTKDQGRTKEQPKNSKSQKRLFIKICFPLYISLLHRETTDRTPRDDREKSDTTPCLQKVLFLKIAFLKKLSPFLKRLTRLLKLLTIFLKTFTPFLKRFCPCCAFCTHLLFRFTPNKHKKYTFIQKKVHFFRHTDNF